MKTNELREKYLEFFETKGCVRRPSDVLVPTWDPSVLFTPAGMNQFKDHFLGKCKLDFTRATTCQKCLRTGDIENVGRTAYHHTFFEMLGNFSFGDYFKRDAINWAWEFLTDKRWLGLDPDRLSVTVYLDDNEAADIWATDIKLPPARIERLGEDENFWPANAPSQGPDGVCGPCSEIFYRDNSGESVEIWNLVFTQFNRVGDPPDNLRPLPSKNIDTGMGLERTAATLQGVETNYHIDILQPIVDAAAEVCGVAYDFDSEDGRRLRRITDHVRACTMAVHENVYPGAQKEKYVIRRLLRRAVLDGHQLGLHDAFLHKLVPAVVDSMKDAYPDVVETTERVAGVIRQEEESFFGTIDAGLDRIEKIFDRMKSDNHAAVDGREAADLYQTYGVPPELFESIAAERNLAFDWVGFRQAMDEHGEASGKAVHTVMGGGGPIDAIKRVLHDVDFCGYETTECEATLKFIVAQNQLCDQLDEVGHESEVVIVLDQTPFYGESGGQVGDIGEIRGEGFQFHVTDTKKDGSLVLHRGHLVEGHMEAGAKVTASVDTAARDGIRRAHSATHILHYALQKELGKHAQQQGSKVEDDYLRFDFTNLAAVKPEQLAAIQQEVDTRVAEAEPITSQILPLADARSIGAMMLFGEKYPDPVRMISMGEFSRELCGGTHLDNTSEVAVVEILSEEAVSAGTRRITALTGAKAKEHQQQTRDALTRAADLLKVDALAVPDAVTLLGKRVRSLKKQAGGGAKGGEESKGQGGKSAGTGEPSYAEIKATLRSAARALNVAPFEVPTRVESLLADAAQLEKELANTSATGSVSADELLASAKDSGGTKIVVADVEGANPNVIRQLIDQIRRKADSAAVLLVAAQGDSKVTLVAGLTPDLVKRGLKAGDWVRETAKVVDGSGGGRPDMAQAGGKDPSKLPLALDKASAHIKQALEG